MLRRCCAASTHKEIPFSSVSWTGYVQVSRSNWTQSGTGFKGWGFKNRRYLNYPVGIITLSLSLLKKNGLPSSYIPLFRGGNIINFSELYIRILQRYANAWWPIFQQHSMPEIGQSESPQTRFTTCLKTVTINTGHRKNGCSKVPNSPEPLSSACLWRLSPANLW